MLYKNLVIYFIPSFLIITAFVCRSVKDKKINNKYGYRSNLSMKNKANWYYANNLMEKICFAMGLVFLLGGFLIQAYLKITSLRLIILLGFELIAYISAGILLENRLKLAHKK
ncbi:SdpI family protein [Anaerococcus tetradius]|uniref:SdpI/YhfL protein family n=1 Tax=Anaerococcus tetradius ATCC 35098 TaxID=525255 RepID=C2CGF0_9FIRM|nr:SdpI family protein [Anaerococcus tetradius]EEI83354.1 hypothetical protein HMPREF0077_0560 [Anaerococcus tetradius ATCC 35098]